MSIQLNLTINNPSSHPQKNNWMHHLMASLGFKQRVDSVRDQAFSSSPACSESNSGRMSKMRSAAQRHIEKMIDSYISRIRNFNSELANTFQDHYPKTYQVALCLGRILRYLLLLSFKSAKNIAFMIYQTLKAVVYAVTHPNQAADEFLQALMKLANKLKKPESWGRIGASIIGTGAAQLVSGNPLAATMMLVGLSLTGASLFIGALCELAKERNLMTRSEAILAYLKNHTQEIPEIMMTAFLMGLLIRALQGTPQIEETQITLHREYAQISLEEAHKIASAYAQEKGLGTVFYTSIDQSTHSIKFTSLRWDVAQGNYVMQGWEVPLPFVEKEVVTHVLKAGHPNIIPATLATTNHSLTKDYSVKA